MEIHSIEKELKNNHTKQKERKNIRWNTMEILALGFLGIILIGAILLMLPICNVKPISFVDALFTSTSAVCVTGLVTIVPAEQFTFLGQIILLILIQIGGLGVVACATGFMMILHRQITVKARIVIQEAYNMDTLEGMVAMIRNVIGGTLIVEGAGAALYAIQFIPEYGLLKGLWFAIFHAISAFCNAGIDVLGASSFMNYVDAPLLNVTTILLIIVSGIGFTVWRDVLLVKKSGKNKKWTFKDYFQKLNLHSKLAIVTTAVLLVCGTVFVFLMERNNPATIGELPLWEKWMAAFFHSTSTRTAGFSTISQSGLRPGTKFFSSLLMFVGGSPGGTAGGVKTTTIAMIVLTCVSVFRNGAQVECFGRRITAQNIRLGFVVVITAVVVLFSGIIALTIFEPDKAFIDLMYEAVSAIGTVGLTADLTAALSTKSHVVIMIMMYLGRIGPISLAFLFGGMIKAQDRIRELPERKIMVG